MTLSQHIMKLIKKHGGLNAAARVARISAPYLMRMRDGDKKDPSDAVLRRLGLRRVVKFVRLDRTGDDS